MPGLFLGVRFQRSNLRLLPAPGHGVVERDRAIDVDPHAFGQLVEHEDDDPGLRARKQPRRQRRRRGELGNHLERQIVAARQQMRLAPDQKGSHRPVDEQITGLQQTVLDMGRTVQPVVVEPLLLQVLEVEGQPARQIVEAQQPDQPPQSRLDLAQPAIAQIHLQIGPQPGEIIVGRRAGPADAARERATAAAQAVAETEPLQHLADIFPLGIENQAGVLVTGDIAPEAARIDIEILGAERAAENLHPFRPRTTVETQVSESELAPVESRALQFDRRQPARIEIGFPLLLAPAQHEAIEPRPHRLTAQWQRNGDVSGQIRRLDAREPLHVAAHGPQRHALEALAGHRHGADVDIDVVDPVEHVLPIGVIAAGIAGDDLRPGGNIDLGPAATDADARLRQLVERLLQCHGRPRHRQPRPGPHLRLQLDQPRNAQPQPRRRRKAVDDLELSFPRRRLAQRRRQVDGDAGKPRLDLEPRRALLLALRAARNVQHPVPCRHARRHRLDQITLPRQQIRRRPDAIHQYPDRAVSGRHHRRIDRRVAKNAGQRIGGKRLVGKLHCPLQLAYADILFGNRRLATLQRDGPPRQVVFLQLAAQRQRQIEIQRQRPVRFDPVEKIAKIATERTVADEIERLRQLAPGLAAQFETGEKQIGDFGLGLFDRRAHHRPAGDLGRQATVVEADLAL